MKFKNIFATILCSIILLENLNCVLAACRIPNGIETAWLETYSGTKWLETQDGKDWLNTINGVNWLQTENGSQWIENINNNEKRDFETAMYYQDVDTGLLSYYSDLFESSVEESCFCTIN